MIISRTPYRVSLFGGGSDFPEWFNIHSGAVLSTTIDKYCYISCRYRPPFFSDRHRIVWSHIETTQAISEILHPAVRAVLEHLGFDDEQGFEIHHQGDLPARSGIGSSSTFIVGLVNALYALRKLSLAAYDLATVAIKIEREILHENVGFQDQIAAAYGSFNSIYLRSGSNFIVEPVNINSHRIKALEESLVLIYTGLSRMSSKISANLIKNIDSKEKIIQAISMMPEHALDILKSNESINEIGKLLDLGWSLKKKLNPECSNQKIDDLYNTALRNGAIGGKLLGAGESGFMLFFVPKKHQPAFRYAMRYLLEIPFRFSYNGSQIIYEE